MFVHIRGGEGAKQRLTLYNESQASLLRNTIRDCVATKKAFVLRFSFFVIRISSPRPPVLPLSRERPLALYKVIVIVIVIVL